MNIWNVLLYKVRVHIFLQGEGVCWECIHVADPKTNGKSRRYVLADLSGRDFTESRGVVPVCFRNCFYPLRFSGWSPEGEFQDQRLKNANGLELTKARLFIFSPPRSPVSRVWGFKLRVAPRKGGRTLGAADKGAGAARAWSLKELLAALAAPYKSWLSRIVREDCDLTDCCKLEIIPIALKCVPV